MSAAARKLDPYKVLGVARDATAETIKAAFRRRAKETHPDVGGKPQDFEKVKRALSVLSDPAKRAKFDKTGDVDEETATNHPDQAAWQMVAAFLLAILADDADVLGMDIVKILKKNLTQQVGVIKKDLAKFGRTVDRAKKSVKRFKKRGEGENRIVDILRWQINEGEAMVTKAKSVLADTERALVLLEDYSFEQEAMAQTMRIDFGRPVHFSTITA